LLRDSFIKQAQLRCMKLAIPFWNGKAHQGDEYSYLWGSELDQILVWRLKVIIGPFRLERFISISLETLTKFFDVRYRVCMSWDLDQDFSSLLPVSVWPFSMFISFCLDLATYLKFLDSLIFYFEGLEYLDSENHCRTGA
jgi:hypothetical protein